MKIEPFRVVAFTLLATTTLGMTACSKPESSPGAPATTQATGAFGTGTDKDGKEQGKAPAMTTPPNLPKPTVADLNDKIHRALDSQVSEQEKLTWIEDAQQDPQLVDKLVAAAKQKNVQVTITNVGDPANGKLKADANVTIDGSPVNNASVDFVAKDNQWQIAHDFACNIVKSAQLNSAACQDN